MFLCAFPQHHMEHFHGERNVSFLLKSVTANTSVLWSSRQRRSVPDVLSFHALTLLMVSERMGWDAALHVAWNGGKRSFFTRRALIAHQSAGLDSPPPHKPPAAEGSLTAFCQVTAHCSITGAFLETGTAEGSVKKGNLLTESFVLHQDQCNLSSKTRQAILY